VSAIGKEGWKNGGRFFSVQTLLKGMQGIEGIGGESSIHNSHRKRENLSMTLLKKGAY